MRPTNLQKAKNAFDALLPSEKKALIEYAKTRMTKRRKIASKDGGYASYAD